MTDQEVEEAIRSCPHADNAWRPCCTAKRAALDLKQLRSETALLNARVALLRNENAVLLGDKKELEQKLKDDVWTAAMRDRENTLGQEQKRADDLQRQVQELQKQIAEAEANEEDQE